MTRQERIQNMEDDLCRACKNNKKCESGVPCVMAHRVSTDLVDMGYRKRVLSLWKDADEVVKYMRKFGDPIKQYLVEEDTLVRLLEEQHRLHCGDRSTFEYFWDAMVESGLDQHVSHREFVDAVENMTFEKLAEMDLGLYEESKDTLSAHWIGVNGDQCSNCGRSLRDLMDGDSYYSSEFENTGFSKLVSCPFCGAKMLKDA